MTLAQTLEAIKMLDAQLGNNGDWLSSVWRGHLQTAVMELWCQFREQVTVEQWEAITATCETKQ